MYIVASHRLPQCSNFSLIRTMSKSFNLSGSRSRGVTVDSLPDVCLPYRRRIRRTAKAGFSFR
jgi:hypothetical protein